MNLAFALHLRGRMLPGVFSTFMSKAERFPGDPWPYAHVLPSWHWMHTSECVADERGCRFGLCRSKTIAPALLAATSAAFNPPQRPSKAPASPKRAAVPQRELFA